VDYTADIKRKKQINIIWILAVPGKALLLLSVVKWKRKESERARL
jgi:hypothetical protein